MQVRHIDSECPSHLLVYAPSARSCGNIRTRSTSKQACRQGSQPASDTEAQMHAQTDRQMVRRMKRTTETDAKTDRLDQSQGRAYAPHPFLAPGAAALGVQAASLEGPLAPMGRGPTGFTAALDASILNVPLFQGCITTSLMPDRWQHYNTGHRYWTISIIML